MISFGEITRGQRKKSTKSLILFFFDLKCISNYFDKQFSIMVRKNIQALFVNV